jgi:hypothetical protein
MATIEVPIAVAFPEKKEQRCRTADSKKLF